MIVTASGLPDALGLDIRAFIATVNVARRRVGELVTRYGARTVTEVMRRMIASSQARLRARLRELPDGVAHAADFIEHDGHQNILYKIDCRATKRDDTLTLDFSGSSRQAPGFINATRSGLLGGCAGGILTTLGFDIQWNQGLLDPVAIVAPDGLICTAQFPAPVGSATVETIWSVSNAVMAALNKLIAASPRYRHRAQCISDGCMATFNLGGINQYGEPFGLHLMDPLAAGSGAFASKDGIDAGGPITSPVSCIADVERNEQAVPLFYLHRRLTPDTGGAGKYRGGLSGEVALTLGGIDKAMALVMTHGAEVPNTQGLAGGWPGATVVQSMGRNAIENGVARKGEWERFGPKPGLMAMTSRDVFSVTWQGGGGDLDEAATECRRESIRMACVGNFDADPGKRSAAKPIASLSEGLLMTQDERGTHVVTRAGYILSTGDTAWRKGARSVTYDKLPDRYCIDLHADLRCTVHYCPATGAQLAVDFHRKDEKPADDLLLDLTSIAAIAS